MLHPKYFWRFSNVLNEVDIFNNTFLLDISFIFGEWNENALDLRINYAQMFLARSVCNPHAIP